MGNKYKYLNIVQDEFNFHNLGILKKEEIINLTNSFIEKAIANNSKIISLITGKGKHSKNGPIIKPLLKTYLKTHNNVENIKEGKYAEGGEGFLIIKLKS